MHENWLCNGIPQPQHPTFHADPMKIIMKNRKKQQAKDTQDGKGRKVTTVKEFDTSLIIILPTALIKITVYVLKTIPQFSLGE